MRQADFMSPLFPLEPNFSCQVEKLRSHKIHLDKIHLDSIVPNKLKQKIEGDING